MGTILNTIKETGASDLTEEYEDKYIETGCFVYEIDSEYDYIKATAIYGTEEHVYALCYATNKYIREELRSLNEGDTIIIKGQIIELSETGGFEIDIYSIDRV